MLRSRIRRASFSTPSRVRRSTRRALFTAALVIVACALVAPFAPARADTASELDDARQRVAQAQAEANAMASELSAAEGRFEQIQAGIAQLQTQIDDARARIQELETIMRDRAVAAYVKRGSDDEFSALLSTSKPMEAARRARFLEQSNQKDDRVVRQLDSLREDLDADQAALEKEREEQAVVKDQLAAQNDVLQQRLAEANRARDELAARLEREQAAAAAAEAARIRALQAASRPQSVTPSSGGGAGQIIANPGGGSFQCPVSGAAYTDDYGPRSGGFHYGIDMFAPPGTPLVAVKAGTLTQMPMDGAGGNEAYLSADGNVYYYAHLSQYAGGPRSVAQGEVIGYVGQTGNASAPHLHFEIRIGGANGSRIDPYPTLSGAGC
jgi:murein DD-endopeptidase MepM/ murein hydrolase activator NlpD